MKVFFVHRLYILTDLSKYSVDDALNEDQRPGKCELLLTIAAPSAARKVREMD